MGQRREDCPISERDDEAEARDLVKVALGVVSHDTVGPPGGVVAVGQRV